MEFLRTQFCPIYSEQLHRQPFPRFFHQPQAVCNLGGGILKFPASVASFCMELRFCTSSHPSLINAAWSAIRKFSWPLHDLTRCPVTSQDSVQFSGDVIVGSGRNRPARFTDGRVTSLLVIPYPTPWKRSGRKYFWIASLTGTNYSQISGGNSCTNFHSCCIDFCSLA